MDAAVFRFLFLIFSVKIRIVLRSGNPKQETERKGDFFDSDLSYGHPAAVGAGYL